MAKYSFQAGGDTDFFNQLADMAIGQTQEPEQQDDLQVVDYGGMDEGSDNSDDYDDLRSRYDELESKVNALSSQRMPNESYDDGFLNFLFSNDNKLPIDWDQVGDYNNTGAPASGGSLSSEIGRREGNYNSLPYTKDGKLASSAVGKYQFVWNLHGSDIQRVTGVHSKEEFQHNPAAQEQYFKYWDSHVLEPGANRYYNQVKQFLPQVTRDQVKMMIHFGGEGNVQKAIQSGNFDQPLDAFGTSLKKYVFKAAGGVAHTAEDQYVGLNNPAYNEMSFPMHGVNTFRGLDSGHPVLIMDEHGNQTILHNKYQTAQMKGHVYEKRL